MKKETRNIYVLNIIVSMFGAKFGYSGKTHNAFLNDNYEIQRFLDSVDGVKIYFNGLQMTYQEGSKIESGYLNSVITRYYIDEVREGDFFLVILNGEGLNLITSEEGYDKHEYKFQVGSNNFITAQEIYSYFSGHLQKCSCGLIINSCNMNSRDFIDNIIKQSRSSLLSNWKKERRSNFVQLPLSAKSTLKQVISGPSDLDFAGKQNFMNEDTKNEYTECNSILIEQQEDEYKFPMLIAGLSSKNVIFQNLEISSLTFGGAIIKGWNAMQLNLTVLNLFLLSKKMLELNSDKSIYYPSLSILCNSKNKTIAKNILNYCIRLNGLKPNK